MKTYEEMTDSVFQRMGEYRKKRRQKRVALPLCCCAILVCCFGAGKLLRWGSDDILTGTVELSDTLFPAGQTDTVSVGQTEAEWETVPDIGDTTGEMYFAPMQGAGDTTEPVKIIPMISDYDGGAVTEISVTPENGEVILSPSLRGALEEYGGEARYRVVTLEYRDGVALEPENLEAQAALAALAGDGIVPVVETMYQDGEVTDTLLSLHVSAEALEAFPADADYGYYLKLYGEAMPDTDEDVVIEAHSFGMMK